MSHLQPTGLAPTRLTLILAGWLIGTALQLQQADWMTLRLALLIFAAGLGVWWLASRGQASSHRVARFGGTLAWCLGAAMLAFAVTDMRAQAFGLEALDPALEGRSLRVTGRVETMVQHNEHGSRFRFKPLSAHMDGQMVRLPAHLDLAWYGNTFDGGRDAPGGLLEMWSQSTSTPLSVRPGELWGLTVRLKAPHGASNPMGFDYELAMWEQGIQAVGYVRTGNKDEPPRRLAQTGWHLVEQWRQTVRDRIESNVPDRRLAGLISALVVGDQKAIDRSDWDIYRATGVAHLMSISGLHITMFAWLAAGLLGLVWRRSTRLCMAMPAPHAAMLGGLLLAGAYAVFCGWGLPAQRTLLMLLTFYVLRMTGRRWPWGHTWLLACVVVVAVDPWALMQAGFWLSFVAVAILFATDPGRLSPSLGSASEASRSAPLARRFLAMVREQWLMTLALAPLSLLLFGQVSLVGLVANLVAIPWVTLVVTPLGMLGVFLSPLWSLAAWALQVLSAVLAWFAQAPFADLHLARAPLWAGVAGMMGAALCVMRLPPALRLAGVPLLLPVLFWQVPRPPMGEFELLAADIGQGNAVIVQTAGHALLYDAGPRFSADNDAGHRVIVPLLRALDLRLNTVVISHRDTDHVGGAATVLAQQPQAELITSMQAASSMQAPDLVRRCEAGQHWQWDGVDFEVLHPSGQDYEEDLKPNPMSCVLRISNGQRAALLVGDLEKPQEARLVAQGAPLRADVLLVPHHGSKTSSSDAFLEAVQPRFGLVQAAYRNRYGHPAASVMQRYQAHGVHVLDTPHCGAQQWQSWVPEQVQCQRDKERRYWHHRLPG